MGWANFSGIDVGQLLSEVEAAAPIDAVPVVAARLAEMVGAREVHFLIADFTGRAVVRLTSTGAIEGARSRGAEQAETVPLAGTDYDRVLRTQQADVLAVDDGARVILPVTNRGDAIGLLELVLPDLPSPQVIATIETAAHALAYVLVAARRHTDVYEWGMRSTPFTLAAEIQRRLLPAAYTCEAGQFTLAGWLEPAAEVGGDTFDYNLDRDALQVSITDAVGHHVAASLLATLLVGSLRNARRKGLDLAGQARYANDSLAENATPGQFVTGQLVRIDLHTGTAMVINAGHTLPLRLRRGVVEEIPLRAELPFGVQARKGFQMQPFPLEPGDRVVFLTDGMLERNAASLDVAAALAETADLHPREVVHALGAAVLRATGGTCATTRRWSAWTGMAGHRVTAPPSRGPTPVTHPRASDPRGLTTSAGERPVVLLVDEAAPSARGWRRCRTGRSWRWGATSRRTPRRSCPRW